MTVYVPTGEIISGSQTGEVSVLVTAEEHFGTNQTLVLLVKVKCIIYEHGDVCVCVGDGGVCCVYGGPHIEGPPQHQCKCQCHCKLKVSGRPSAWPFINLLLPCNFSLKPRIKFLLVACTAVRRHGRGIGRRYVVWHLTSWTNFASRLSQTIQKA